MSVLFDRGYVLYIVSVFVAILIRGLESRGQVIGSRYVVGGSPGRNEFNGIDEPASLATACAPDIVELEHDTVDHDIVEDVARYGRH